MRQLTGDDGMHKRLWQWVKRLFAFDLKYYNSTCQSCGHPWTLHSFYGISRSECHHDRCECTYYVNTGSSIFGTRKCQWCDTYGDPIDVMLHEIKEHTA